MFDYACPQASQSVATQYKIGQWNPTLYAVQQNRVMFMTIIETKFSWVNFASRRPKGTGSLAADLVAHLGSEGLLPFRAKLSADEAFPLACFLRDLNAALSNSKESERADPSTEAPIDSSGCFAPHLTRTPTVRRVERALSKLNQHERALILWLQSATNRRGVTLNQAGHEWAPFCAQYDNAAENVALGLLKGLCRSLAEVYPPRAPSFDA